VADREGAGEGQGEAERPDHQAGAQVAAEGQRVDLGPGQEGEQHRAGAGQEGGESGLLDEIVAVGQVARDRSHHDLDQRHRDADADGDQAGQKGESYPGGRDGIDVQRDGPSELRLE